MGLDKSICELFDLTGKTAVVTGSAKGIGFGVAKKLAEAGANVVLCDVNADLLTEAVNKLKDQNLIAIGIIADVRQEEDIKKVVSETIKAFGGIDILVNNAGVYRRVPLLEITGDEWDMLMSINAKGAFLMTREVAKQMIEQNHGGSIINMSSTGAFKPNIVGMAHYHATKGAVLSFTNHISVELAPYKIRVNAICPGAIDVFGTTHEGINDDPRAKAALEKIPLKRIGKPEDIANGALFLASNASSYITGDALIIDGGLIKG